MGFETQAEKLKALGHPVRLEISNAGLRHIVILGPWLFIIAVWIGYIWIGQEMELLGVIILFILALGGSAVLASLNYGRECCESEVDWTNEMQSIHSKLDTLTEDVGIIKKAIEE